MKRYIRTVEGGKTLPLDTVNAKRVAVKEAILNTGMQYVESEARLGSYNAMGVRIEEKVYIIEAVEKDNYA